MSNPYGDRVRIVDRRKVNFDNIDRHIAMQEAPEPVKVFAKLPLPEIERMERAAAAKGDGKTADLARRAAELRMTGVPPELTGPGQLHEVTMFDPRTARAETRYFGDSRVWRGKFDQPGQSVVMPPAKAWEKIEGNVEIAGHETLIARAPDGSERIVRIQRSDEQ